MNGLPVMKQRSSLALDADERGFAWTRADLSGKCFLPHPRSSACIRVQDRFVLTRVIAPVC
jgi:hypothetical protein